MLMLNTSKQACYVFGITLVPQNLLSLHVNGTIDTEKQKITHIFF